MTSPPKKSNTPYAGAPAQGVFFLCRRFRRGQSSTPPPCFPPPAAASSVPRSGRRRRTASPPCPLPPIRFGKRNRAFRPPWPPCRAAAYSLPWRLPYLHLRSRPADSAQQLQSWLPCWVFCIVSKHWSRFSTLSPAQSLSAASQRRIGAPDSSARCQAPPTTQAG